MTQPATSAALAQRYDAIPYPTVPYALTHPDRMASVASFLGMSPPPVATARVLEVGCGDGANLIPMAAALSSARCVGCDLSARAIDAGRATVTALGLTNVVLLQEDLTALAPEHGSFDYLIAHGVYSWVPPAVRDGLFALASARLAPNGIVFVSYSTLPGSRPRQVAWEMLHRHVDRIDDLRARLAAARELASIVAAGRSFQEADDALRAEFRAIAQQSDSALFHDTLAVPNDPVWFEDFTAHSARFGLRFLAEVEVHTMSAAGLAPEAREFIGRLDPAAREPYLDYARLRRFRQSLLCRVDAPADLAPLAIRMDAMHVSADPSLLQAAAKVKLARLARDFDPAGGGGGFVRGMLEQIVQHAPAAIPIRVLRDAAKVQTLPRPLEALVTDAYVSNLVNLHVHPPAVVATAGERPLAGVLARFEATRGEDLTSLLHTRVQVPDANARRLLALLDGTRDRNALAAAIDGPAFGYRREVAQGFVEHALAQFARMGLLAA